MPSARARPLFSREFFQFFRELQKNNNRPWFLRNKARYEQHVLGACLAFVDAVGPAIGRISPNLVADSRPVGGSLMRIYRDIRFSKDKSPYRTSMGVHFFYQGQPGHEGGLPGFFLYLAPGESFVASGMWMPPAADLTKIRTAIVHDSTAWARAKSAGLAADESALKRVPPGYDPGIPLADDLKRKSFVARVELSDADVISRNFTQSFIADCRRLDGLNRFLAKAVGIPY
jgi:uncharacterized protein (TIGR02453 family)